MNERAALLVVDPQNDFCPGGSLAVPGGDLIIPVVNRYIEIFAQGKHPVFASRDWHPAETGHFREYGGLWPPHCIRETAGARFHPVLRLPTDAMVVSKGMDPTRDDYSAFNAVTEEGRPFAECLRELGITHLFVCGLATDYCVRQSSLDALTAGFGVTVLTDAVKGVDLTPGDSERALKEIVAAGGECAVIGEVEERYGKG
jgi:nicotinamidase/pyrazinamidase